MHSKIGCFVASFLLLVPVTSIEWSANISMPFSIDYGVMVKKVKNGYIAIVNSLNLLENKSYGRVIKLHENGHREWEIRFLSDTEMGLCIQNGYTILSSYEGKGRLMMLNEEGKILWNKTYGFSFPVKATNCVINVNGNYIFSLHSHNIDGKSVVVKTDGMGNIIWRRIFNYSTYIAKIEDGYVVLEKPETFCRNYSILIKYDFNDRQIWRKKVEGIEYSLYPAIRGFLLYSYYKRTMVKYDLNGGEEWRRELEKEIYISSCRISRDGYLLAGGKSVLIPKTECILIKLDESGREIWRRTYFLSSYNLGFFILRNCWFADAEENDGVIGIVNIDAEPNAIFVHFPPLFILLTWFSLIETDVAIVKIKEIA